MASPRPVVAEEAYTVVEAAALKRVSPDLIKRAIRATEGNVLKAKVLGKGYRISASALEEWWAGVEDA